MFFSRSWWGRFGHASTCRGGTQTFVRCLDNRTRVRYPDERMYAAGHGIKQMRATRAGDIRVRLLPALGLVVAATLGLALVAHGGTPPSESRVVVQPGDTLWSIASDHYPGDDV